LRYRNTRHNVGFKVLSKIAAKYRISIKRKGFSGTYGAGKIIGKEVILFEPLTYMNLSGAAVQAAGANWLEKREDLLVVSDDVNLPLGSIRIREKGSSGGHNGLQSVIDRMGEDFARLRVGVGAGHEAGEMADYVLSSFPRKDRALLEETLDRAVKCIEVWLDRGIKKAMAGYNKNISLE